MLIVIIIIIRTIVMMRDSDTIIMVRGPPTITMVDPRVSNPLESRSAIEVNGRMLKVETRRYNVCIEGATCQSCCDTIIDSSHTDRPTAAMIYGRHTLSTVFD